MLSSIELPHCTIDLSAQVVRLAEEEAQLRRQEVALLHYLAARPGQLVTRKMLLVDVWGYHEHTHTRAIDITVARLRKKIEPDPRLPRHLLSVRGHGYRWVAQPDIKSAADTSVPSEADPAQPQTNLTGEVTAFIGREDELSHLQSHQRQARRLVTIHGPGGTGKTRLAREFGFRQLENRSGGVWFCDLSEVRDLDGVVGAVAATLGVSLSKDDPVVQLGAALAGRGDILLILDNFEQLVDVARETVAVWHRAAPEACFVVTSRILLGLVGEQVLPLGALSVEEAVTLFVDRARAVRPTFSLTDDNRATVATLVQDLDCLSLAIELAAARMRVLTPAQIHGRLAQRFEILQSRSASQSERHATLHGTIDWSWDLLNAEEKEILSQCRVFRGGFSIDAAEAVLVFETAPVDVLNVVESLCDQSVLRLVEPEPDVIRFTMLESIRAYLETKRMTEHSWQGVRARHARHFASLWDADKAQGGELRAIARYGALLAREFDNLSVANDCAIEAKDGVSAGSCALAVHESCRASGRFALSLAAIQRVLPLANLPDEDRIALHREAGWVLRRLGRDEEALAHVERGMALASAPQMQAVRCLLQSDCGYLFFRLGRMEEARDQYDRALKQARSGQHRKAAGLVLGNLGILLNSQGDMAAARQHYESAVAELRAVRFWPAVAHALVNLGILHVHAGRAGLARQCLEEARGLQRDSGSEVNEAAILSYLGGMEAELGDVKQARRHFEEAARIHRKLGHRRALGVAIGSLGDLDLRDGKFKAARDQLEQAVAFCETTWPVGAAAFRGSLGCALIGLGALEAGRGLLEAGHAGLSGKHVIGLAKLLCDWAKAELDHGDRAEAKTRLAEAKQVVANLELTADSELLRSIEELEQRLFPG